MTLAARRHIARTCPIFAALIRRVGPCRMETDRQTPYEALVRAIAHQQLHGKAARTITARFVALGGTGFPTPAEVLSFDDAALRGCGFSAGKIAAIRDIALHAQRGVVPNRRQATRMSDARLIERLTTIRGVGRWTVEMLLMFTLERPDILPVDDFGVREGYRILYDLPEQPKPRELAAIGEAWAPYRSTAAWYLWRAVDEARAA
ncbi:MAG: DNA-3-methyladenine glycosylase 2 family protein [Rhodospirillales bacterium]|nr:DNA-3-methyladenine glycosylase 2 family protein [Rhodospirillales bacterium]